MVYVMVGKEALTLKDVAVQYDIPLKLVRGRYARGLRTIEDLIQKPYEMVRK